METTHPEVSSCLAAWRLWLAQAMAFFSYDMLATVPTWVQGVVESVAREIIYCYVAQVDHEYDFAQRFVPDLFEALLEGAPCVDASCPGTMHRVNWACTDGVCDRCGMRVEQKTTRLPFRKGRIRLSAGCRQGVDKWRSDPRNLLLVLCDQGPFVVPAHTLDVATRASCDGTRPRSVVHAHEALCAPVHPVLGDELRRRVAEFEPVCGRVAWSVAWLEAQLRPAPNSLSQLQEAMYGGLSRITRQLRTRTWHGEPLRRRATSLPEATTHPRPPHPRPGPSQRRRPRSSGRDGTSN